MISTVLVRIRSVFIPVLTARQPFAVVIHERPDKYGNQPVTTTYKKMDPFSPVWWTEESKVQLVQ